MLFPSILIAISFHFFKITISFHFSVMTEIAPKFHLSLMTEVAKTSYFLKFILIFKQKQKNYVIWYD